MQMMWDFKFPEFNYLMFGYYKPDNGKLRQYMLDQPPRIQNIFRSKILFLYNVYIFYLFFFFTLLYVHLVHVLI